MHAIWPALEDEVSCFSEVSPVVSCHPRGEDATLLLPPNAGCVFLPAQESACAHGEPIQGAHPSEIPGYPTAHCPLSCPNQPSVGCRGQVAGAAPLGYETTARTGGNLSSISSHLPTCFQLWQHWRIQAKEKKSRPPKVERHFRHWCRQLQQGSSESQ